MNDLKVFLSSAAGQHIQQVYLNKKNEWLFAPRPGFEKMLTREEVLASGTMTNTNEAGANIPTKDSKNSPSSFARPKQSNRF